MHLRVGWEAFLLCPSSLSYAGACGAWLSGLAGESHLSSPVPSGCLCVA